MINTRHLAMLVALVLLSCSATSNPAPHRTLGPNLPPTPAYPPLALVLASHFLLMPFSRAHGGPH
jgi:hypothetical protein